MNQIKEVYSRVTADRDAVDAAIVKAKQEKITRFPARRAVSVAAGFVAAAVVIGAAVFILQHRAADFVPSVSREAQADVAYEAPQDAAGAVLSDPEITAVDFSDEELTVTYRSGSIGEDAAQAVTLFVEDEAGSSVPRLQEEESFSENGERYVTAHFEPIPAQDIVCKFYQGETLLQEIPVAKKEG